MLAVLFTRRVRVEEATFLMGDDAVVANAIANLPLLTEDIWEKPGRTWKRLETNEHALFRTQPN